MIRGRGLDPTSPAQLSVTGTLEEGYVPSGFTKGCGISYHLRDS